MKNKADNVYRPSAKFSVNGMLKLENFFILAKVAIETTRIRKVTAVCGRSASITRLRAKFKNSRF